MIIKIGTRTLLLGGEFNVADIAVGAMLGVLNIVQVDRLEGGVSGIEGVLIVALVEREV